MRPLLLPLLLLLAAPLATPVAAQNLFAPVARVGDQVVTAYELEQRARFNAALGATGDLRAVSLEQLVEDRLRLAAAERDGVAPTEEELDEAAVEFASRAGLSAEEFLAAIAEAGVEPETYRDFLRAGLAYRQVVQARFGRQVDVGEADVDRALARVEPPGEIEVTLAEIILPADTPEREAQSLAIAQEVGTIRSFEAFSEAARQVSFAATRDAGGRLEPIPLSNLPPPLQAELRALDPGEVSGPIPLPNALVLFQLRGLRETGAAAEPPQAIDYAAFYIPGGRSPEALAEAARLRAQVDGCDDLYGAAQGLPPERLERGVRPLGAIPADVAAQLALLDPGEVSTALTRAGGQTLVFLMLCERDPRPEPPASILGAEAPEAAPTEPEAAGAGAAGAGAAGPEDAETTAPSREAVAVGIRNQRLQGFADAYLDELRADLGVEILGQP